VIGIGQKVRSVHEDAKGWCTITEGVVYNVTAVCGEDLLEIDVTRLHVEHKDHPGQGRDLCVQKGSKDCLYVKECLPIPLDSV
jgi:hypothetical protein